MPNDTLDEIERQWRNAPLTAANWFAAVRTLIEMVRARDIVIRHAVACLEDYEADQDDREKVAQLCRAALDTPPAQEPGER